jgi:hypothetical protein
MTEDTADTIAQLRKLWADVRLDGVTLIEVNGQPVGPDRRDVEFGVCLDYLEMERAENHAVLFQVADLADPEITVTDVLRVMGAVRQRLEHQTGGASSMARIKAQVLNELLHQMDGVGLQADDFSANCLKALTLGLRNQYQREAVSE